ncbi:MAG: DUF4351 domain-containing protein, partial [Deltaproteobacteria bacterium]|nr:DUF4351 domain-containing protein [Deltaproteobacteria bacterium]
IEQGIEQGRLSGKATLTLRLLEKKFGSVPEAIRTRIESGNAQQLLEWSETILTADRIDDIFIE